MLGYQSWRCMKHNLIADVIMKPRWFLKIFWENFVVKNLPFFNVRIVKGRKTNIFRCKLCAWVIFIILFTSLLCDNSNSLTYEPRKGAKVQHFHMPAVWLYISCRLAFHNNNGNLDVWRPVLFSNQCLKKRLLSFKKQ